MGPEILEPQYTEAIYAGLQVGMMLFGPVWAVRIILSLILQGGRHD